MFSIALLALLCIFAAFVVSNLSEALPLVFLGAQTVPLPVGIWLLLFLTAGIAVSLLVGTLLKFAVPTRSRSKRRDRDSRSFESQRSAGDRFSKPPLQTQPSPPPRTQRQAPETFEPPPHTPPYESDDRAAYEEFQAQYQEFQAQEEFQAQYKEFQAQEEFQARDEPVRERSSKQGPAPEIAEDFDLQPDERSAAASRKRPGRQNAHPEEKKEEWYDEEFFEDWEKEERVRSEATESPESTKPKVYEKKQELENQSWQGSIYAYTYRKSEQMPESEAEGAVGEKAISLGKDSANAESANEPANQPADETTAEVPSETPASVSPTERFEALPGPPMAEEKWDDELFPDEEPSADDGPVRQGTTEPIEEPTEKPADRTYDAEYRVVIPPLSPKKSSDRKRDGGGSDWESSDRKEDW